LIADSGESISDDPERALLLASEALNTRLRSNDPPLPEAEDAVHRALLAANLRLILRGHTGNVTGVAFSPDSKRLATVSDDDTVKLWDTVTGRQLSSFSAHSGGLRAVVFMFDNLRLITAGKDGTTRIWNISNAQPTLTLRGHSGPVNAIALNASETLLATAGDDKTARLWDPVTGRELFTLSGHTNSIHGIAFSHNGKRVATSAYDATAKVWDTATGKQLFNLPDHTDSHGAIAFSPNDRTLATPGRGATITLWNADTGEEYKTLSDNSDVIESLAYGRDGNLAAGSADGSVRIWHGEDIRPIAIMRGRSDGVLAVAFSPNGELAATGDTDSLAKIWADPNPEESGTPRSHIHSAVNGLFSPGDQCLAMVRPEKASPNNPQITRIFDISTGAMLQTLKSRTGYMRPLAFSPDCKQIAFDESRYTVSFYDISTGRIVSKLLGYASTPTALAFSPDGKRAVLASTDNTITAWDTATGKRQLFIAADAGVVSEIKYSADGKQIAVAGQTVKLWDTATGRLLHSLPRPRNSLHIEFSPDDRMFATSAGAGSATKVWDIEQGRETVTLNAFDHATFSPDGSRLAGTAADDIKIANASTGQILSTLRGHPLTNRLAFSLDGKRLLTYGSDGLRVFYLDPHDLVDLARSRITRDPPTFTEDECRRLFQKKPCPTRERAADDFRTPRP
jgi:WD40 repeat protein